jgi:hypothetical protein
MAKKKVFVSYDHSEDLKYKNLLKAWDANDNFDFEFDQRSPDEAIDSENAPTIKQSLTRMMKDADYLLVIVGEKSHKSNWMSWEIERAKQDDTKLKLAAVKISNSYTSPAGLIGCNTAFATSFTQNAVITALDNATNKY